ncbi:MAG: DUF167 domain-containing protein [Rhodospirillales bacterium]|nr:DUF167 domain-containing protein [Rhodospirillales bacterium]
MAGDSKAVAPFRVRAGALGVPVKLTPKARRNAISGMTSEAHGGALLKVSVTAPPVDGKANAALIKLLAKEWHLPKSSLEITRGASDRLKLV